MRSPWLETRTKGACGKLSGEGTGEAGAAVGCPEQHGSDPGSRLFRCRYPLGNRRTRVAGGDAESVGVTGRELAGMSLTGVEGKTHYVRRSIPTRQRPSLNTIGQ